MGAVRTAVVGVGQTRHVSARHDVSIAGLVREAALEALEDAGMDFGDIDAVVVGKAPDTFEGVIMPELYLADALGAVAPASVSFQPSPSAQKPRFSNHIGSYQENGTYTSAQSKSSRGLVIPACA